MGGEGHGGRGRGWSFELVPHCLLGKELRPQGGQRPVNHTQAEESPPLLGAATVSHVTVNLGISYNYLVRTPLVRARPPF